MVENLRKLKRYSGLLQMNLRWVNGEMTVRLRRGSLVRCGLLPAIVKRNRFVSSRGAKVASSDLQPNPLPGLLS